MFIRFIILILVISISCGCTSCRKEDSGNSNKSMKVVKFTCPDTAAIEPLGSVANKDDRDFLLRYLSSSPNWRVHDEGATVADLRNVNKTYSGKDDTQLEIRIRFTPYEKTRQWFADACKDGRIADCQIGKATIIELPLWESSDASEQMGSCIVLTMEDIWIEILEWSKDELRVASRRGIESVATEIGNVIRSPKNIDSADFWRRILPEDSVAEQESLTVERYDGGQFRIRGSINQGSPGIVVVRAFDLATGKECQKLKATLRRSEHVGWSNDREVFFPFDCRYDTSDLDINATLRFEAWFYPAPLPGRHIISTISTVEQKLGNVTNDNLFIN